MRLRHEGVIVRELDAVPVDAPVVVNELCLVTGRVTQP